LKRNSGQPTGSPNFDTPHAHDTHKMAQGAKTKGKATKKKGPPKAKAGLKGTKKATSNNKVVEPCEAIMIIKKDKIIKAKITSNSAIEGTPSNSSNALSSEQGIGADEVTQLLSGPSEVPGAEVFLPDDELDEDELEDEDEKFAEQITGSRHSTNTIHSYCRKLLIIYSYLKVSTCVYVCEGCFCLFMLTMHVFLGRISDVYSFRFRTYCYLPSSARRRCEGLSWLHL
jgi:hypothetical protein